METRDKDEKWLMDYSKNKMQTECSFLAVVSVRNLNSIILDITCKGRLI